MGERDEDTVMEDCFDAGASDVNFEEDGIAEVVTEPNELSSVRDAFEAKGYTYQSAEVAYIPATYSRLEDPEQLKKIGQLFEHLDDCEDIQEYWHNLENEEDIPD